MNNIVTYKKVNKAGAFTIPAKIRRDLLMQAGDGVEISVTDNKIIIEAYNPRCVICNSQEEVKEFKSKNICSSCLNDLKELEV